MRGSVFAITNTAARIGAAISPLMEEEIKDKSLYCYAGLAFVCLVLVRFLRETKKQPLMTTLDDLKELFVKPLEPEKEPIYK